MSLTVAELDKLRAAGIPAETLLTIVRARLECDAEETAARRAKAAAKKRKQRAQRDFVPECPGDTGGQPGTQGDIGLLEQKGFPEPLPKTQTSNPSEPKGSSGKTTHAREAADFERFWLAYPRKVGKGAARKAFPAACRKIGGEPIGVLLAGLERAKAMWRDPQFIPNPATWLSQERWADEPSTVTPFPGKSDDRPKPSTLDQRFARSFAGARSAAARRALE